ncbi:5-hydroxytryptamine receptor 3C-like [Suncus etruscus]|uniref:5-hydroxytryptamine receptor 3C-like n=1 Tax=Suncus etruscus TaxID=109475 RepID=UPI0021103281|nr:5-hydroxytryptamine receptor 3C-like [Suncus etruscus]
MERVYPISKGFLLGLIISLLLQGLGDSFTINCSGFDQHGVNPTAFQAVFDRKAFRPFLNHSIPTQVNVSFTLSAILEVDAHVQLLTSFLWMNLMWDNPFISWDPAECTSVNKLSISAENLWVPDIFIVEATDVHQAPPGLRAYVSSEGRIKYDVPVRVTSICNLDIFYFPFDQQNCSFTFSSFLYTVESLLLGMDKEVWEITDISQNIIQTQGEWELLGISKATPKMSVGSSLYDQIIFYVVIRRRPGLYILNLLVPSSFLVVIDALSFYLPAENENRAPFKITLLLGYNVFLLMMNDLLPNSGTPLISIYFSLCLSLMVISLLETIFISYLLHLANTQPPPMPPRLLTLLLYCTSPWKGCLTVPQKGSRGLPSSHLPGVKEPMELGRKEARLRRAESQNGSLDSAKTQQEDEAHKRHLVNLWVLFSHMMDTLLFRLYLIFLATSIITVIVLWNN